MIGEFVVYALIALLIFVVAYVLFRPAGTAQGGLAGLFAELATHQRQVAISAVFIFIAIFTFFAYWVLEPTRMQAATHKYERIDAERGMAAFTTNCSNCHGPQGQGVVGPALTMDQLAARHKWDLTSDTDRRAAEKFLFETIANGRPAGPLAEGVNRPMPAWSQKAGGPMIEQQVRDTVTFLLDADPEKWAHATAYASQHSAPAAPAKSDGAASPADRGRQLMTLKACGGCHALQGVPGAAGTVGPDLTHFGSSSTIAGTLPMSEDNLKRWLKNPPAMKPGTLMPSLGLSDEDTQALATFLLSLK